MCINNLLRLGFYLDAIANMCTIYATTWAFLVLLCCGSFTIGTISPDDKNKAKELIMLNGPQSHDVFGLNLISSQPFAKDILENHNAYYKDTSARHFNGTTLGYVTPWNSHGYNVAKIFAKKMDIISPVWLQVLKKDDGYALEDTHVIDTNWLKEVRRKGKTQTPVQHTVKVFPRIIFVQFTDPEIKLLLSVAKERTKVNDLLIKSCKEYGFDGIVLELWSQLAGRIDDQYLYTLVLQMAKDLKKHDLHVILVIPPHRTDILNMFGEKHMNMLYKHIYAFSLTTYDFSTVQRPGANAPLYWMRRAVERIVPLGSENMAAKRAKILMGLNMYGNDYTPDGGGPITFVKYLELVRNVKKQLSNDERDVENFFEVKNQHGRHIVFYPTLYSINERIKLAQELGVGISIWELGQGLNYFYDLF